MHEMRPPTGVDDRTKIEFSQYEMDIIFADSAAALMHGRTHVVYATAINISHA